MTQHLLTIDWRPEIVAARPTTGSFVLVSSDDAWLTAGGGVSAAIAAVAGPGFASQRAAAVERAGGRIAVGELALTGGGLTGASHVIHAVTLDWRLRRRARGGLLRDLVLAVLDQAACVDATTLLLPHLATGAAGATHHEFNEALDAALATHLQAPTPLRHLIVCGRQVQPSATKAVLVGWPGPDHRDAAIRSLQTAVDDLVARLKGMAASAVTSSRGDDGALHTLATELDAAGYRLAAEHLRIVDRPAELPDATDPAWVPMWRALYAAAAAISAFASHARSERLSGALSAAGSFVGSAALDAMRTIASVGWLPGLLTAGLSRPAEGTKPVEPRPPVEVTPSIPPSPVGRTPDERLAALLLRELDPDTRELLLARLTNEQKRGSDLAKVTEYVLDGASRKALFDIPPGRRRRLAIDHAGLAADETDDNAIVDAILSWLGFDNAQTPRGLSAFRAELSAAAKRAKLEHTVDGASAQAQKAACLVEELIRLVVAFHCGAWLGKDAATFVADDEKLRGSFSKMGIGGLVPTARKLSDALAKNERFAAVYGTRRLLPPGVDQIAPIRNRIAHPGSPLTKADITRLFELALEVIDHLGAGDVPLMPLVVVVVEERRHIQFGHRWSAVTDEGIEEQIHTDEPLVLGQRYFVLPHSNPIRVFPTIVAYTAS